MRAKRPGSKPRPTFPNGKLGPDPRWYDAANIRPQIGNRQARSLGSKRWHEANPPVPIDHKYDDQVRRTRVRKIRKREGVCRECDRPSPGHTLCLVHRRLSCMRAQDAYQKRRAAGVCASCVARAAPGRVHCRVCGVARRKITSAKRRNQTRLAAGLCPRCTAPLALGRVSCAGCLSDRRVARRARKAKWATANLCMKCGGAREDTRLHCAHCRAQSYAYKKQYRVDGLCQCGRFRADGRQSCESCLRIHREYQRRRRASCAILAVQGKTRAMNAGFRS